MQEWHNTTIVCIKPLSNGKFKVLELPARAKNIIQFRRSFNTIELAEAHIADQYPDAETFTHGDMEQERAFRLRSAAQMSIAPDQVNISE